MAPIQVLVVGGGHAGIEAALAAARLGCSTQMVTQASAEIGRMPCNPAIGGLGKAHLVREIDALGGEMALAIDQTGIQFRVLNRRKGPAVQSPRAQADKHAYQRRMLAAVLAQPGLEVVEGEAVGLLVESAGASRRRRVAGVKLADGRELAASRVILSTGTFLRGLMHVGQEQRRGGREGAASADGLSGDLARHGFILRRLKTGTPMRLRRGSLDFTRLDVQAGDEDPQPFSFRTGPFAPLQVACHLTHTIPRTHELILANLDRSPLYAGVIEGRGPRYCPSIEDKVVRFAQKERHLIFLEPEGLDTDEIYVNGLSTSLPADVQEKVVRSIPGLEKAELARYGYAVEYDSLPSYQIKTTLESKLIDQLYFSGQLIGTSGYEEAAAQGLMAGINAALAEQERPPFTLDRSEAYIGVLIDDLTTKEISEPYRMFTSRAEFRLALRCDNAGTRLLARTSEIGLLPRPAMELLRARAEAAERMTACLSEARLVDPAGGGLMAAADLLRRPEVDLEDLLRLENGGRELEALLASMEAAPGEDGFARRWVEQLREQVQADVKYSGYIARQEKLVRRQRHMEALEIPDGFDYAGAAALSFEAREKLSRMRPATIGQAGRIDGVRAADLAILSVLVQKCRNIMK